MDGDIFFIDSELPWVMEVIYTGPSWGAYTIFQIESSPVGLAYGSQRWVTADKILHSGCLRRLR